MRLSDNLPAYKKCVNVQSRSFIWSRDSRSMLVGVS